MKDFYGIKVTDFLFKVLTAFITNKSNANWLRENHVAEIEYDYLYIDGKMTKDKIEKMCNEISKQMANETKFLV